MRKVKINDREEYDYVVERGYEPLLNPVFSLDHELRVDIQRELFGRGNKQVNNQKFYLWVWKKKGPGHRCEECGAELHQYRAIYISHILSRGGYPEMAYDPRNTNILCPRHHHQWENDPRGMFIYLRNKDKVEQLKHEYQHRNKEVRV